MQADEVPEICRGLRRKVLPKADDIVKEAFRDLNLLKSSKTPKEALKDFNKNLRGVFDQTLVVLERYERKVYVAALREVARRRESELKGKAIGDALEAPLPKRHVHRLVIRSGS